MRATWGGKSVTVGTPYLVRFSEQREENQPPQLDRTMVLDTKRVKDMLLQKRSPVSAKTDVQTLGLAAAFSARTGERRIGTLTVVAGRKDRQEYLLLSKLAVIGKSQMATNQLCIAGS
jgi:hypothetical protein